MMRVGCGQVDADPNSDDDADIRGYANITDDSGQCFDGDSDGSNTCDDNVDCNDSDLTIAPGAEELCNELDDDCDGEIDENCTCPILSYPCSDGCCEIESEVVSQARGQYGSISIDEDGNIFIANVRPSGGFWTSEVAVLARDSLDTGFTHVMDFAIHNDQAYVIHRVPGTTYEENRVHLSVVDLHP